MKQLYLHIGLDVAEIMTTKCMGGRLLGQLEVTERGKLKGEVLQCVGRLVQDEHWRMVSGARGT